MTHTKGPWTTPGEDGGERVIAFLDSQGKQRTLAHVYDGEEHGSMESNARLIAAAPELLISLKEMVHFDDLPESEQQPAVERARAAIARATGQ
jgi:hypothetical protein